MHKLIIVSNRLPVTVEKKKGKLRFRHSAGGLATGLNSFYKSCNGVWIGWCGISSEKVDKEEKKRIETKLMTDSNSYPVFLTKREVDRYYYGFSNKTIWPLLHSFTQYVVYDKDFWESYKRVNQLFCDKVLEIANPGDTIWIHDYHLMLLPLLIREKLPGISIGFFLHTPFSPGEIFHLLPWRKEVLEGVMGADVIGFHTYDYANHFLNSIRRLLGCEHVLGQVTFGNRVVKVDAFPMGIDYQRFSNTVKEPVVEREINEIRRKVGDRKIILSIDRLDYTKGILQRLEAFDTFLDNNPEYKGKIVLVLIAIPSRTSVEHYRLLKKRLDELVGNINGRHGNIGWTPILYIYGSIPFNKLLALYNIADVALVTPLRDGMNLVAKEFIAAKTDGKGVLVLGEMAGASKELGEAIIVNPNDKENIMAALKEALMMPEKEQINRNRPMQARLQSYNVKRWANDFVESLSNIKKLQQELYARKISEKTEKQLITDYAKSNNRLILLDCDGTLVPFAETPQKAKPDNNLLSLLGDLAVNKKNEVIITSGRDRKTLVRWFNELNVGLIAEHGAWIKENAGSWETVVVDLKTDWKEKIRPVLEHYVDRTPGSFIEEKDFSLVWHYRKVDQELAQARAMELKSTVMDLTTSFNLCVLEGNKVLEIKQVGVDKGQAALKFTSKKKWDFILAIGDDWTDEDTFSILPETAYSIKVGISPSKARFNLASIKDVISLLKELRKK